MRALPGRLLLLRALPCRLLLLRVLPERLPDLNERGVVLRDEPPPKSSGGSDGSAVAI